MFRPHAVSDALTIDTAQTTFAIRRRQTGAVGEFDFGVIAGTAQRAGNEVHGRRTDETGDEYIGRAVIQFQRRPRCSTRPSRMTTIWSAMVIASI